MSASAAGDSDSDNDPPPLPPSAAAPPARLPPAPPTPSGFSNVVELLQYIRRPELVSAFQSEEVSDELLPYVDVDSFLSLGLTKDEAHEAIAFRASGYRTLPTDSAVCSHVSDDASGKPIVASSGILASRPNLEHARRVHCAASTSPTLASNASPASSSSSSSISASTPSVVPPSPLAPIVRHVPAPASFSGHSTASVTAMALAVQRACRCSAARRALALQVSLYDSLVTATAGISVHSQKCLSVLARLLRLQRKCEEHNMGLAAHLDMSLKSSSGFLADVSLPTLFGNVQQLICAWKAVEIKMASAAAASSLPALTKWWRALHAEADGATLGHTLLHALQLSAAHASSLIMGGGALWAWLLKTRPAVQSFMSLALRSLAASDVEEDIFSMIMGPIHAMADVCSQLVLLCDLNAVDFDFVMCASSITRVIQSQLEVFLSQPPSFSPRSILKLSWVQVCKVSFVSSIPPPPGLLSSPPLPSAITTASFVPDCLAVIAAINSDIRIVFPCWPWVLQLPSAEATLEIDCSGTGESTSTALLSLAGIGSLHVIFNSRVLEKSWSELINRDRSSRSCAPSADDSDWRICCSIIDTEQRSDLIREYTLYVIRVKHHRLEWAVSRRFSDFELLVKQLQQELPAWAFNQLSQLPSAKSFGQAMNKNSVAVVEMRRMQLELYLSDLCSHRAACKSNSFRKFLDFQSRLQEADDSKSNSSVDSNAASSLHSSASPSLRGVAAAVMASFSGRRTLTSSSSPKGSSPQLPDSNEATIVHSDSPHVSRATVTRRDAPEHSRPVIVEPVMYAVLYKRGGFHNSGFLRKSSWKNKAVAIWRGLLAYWPAVEEDKTRVEPLNMLGNPTSVVDLVGARITSFAERANSFEIHVSDGIITFAAHSSEAFSAWLSCLVSCIVPSSETFMPPNISVLLGLSSAPRNLNVELPAAPSDDVSSSDSAIANFSVLQGATVAKESATAVTWFSFPLSSAKEPGDLMPLMRLVSAVQAVLEDASPAVLASIADILVEIDTDAYSALRSTATGRATTGSSWVRLKALVSELRQNMFHELLSRVGSISASQPPQPYALTGAACPFGAATEAAAIIVCLRAYLDEQALSILPDDRDGSIFHLPAPVIDFIRALLNMSFFIFPHTDAAFSSKLSSFIITSGDDANAKGRMTSLTSSISKQAAAFASPSVAFDSSLDASGKRTSLTVTPLKRGSAITGAVSGSISPIVLFLASSMCRSTHGMFADAACGSIR